MFEFHAEYNNWSKKFHTRNPKKKIPIIRMPKFRGSNLRNYADKFINVPIDECIGPYVEVYNSHRKRIIVKKIFVGCFEKIRRSSVAIEFKESELQKKRTAKKRPTNNM